MQQHPTSFRRVGPNTNSDDACGPLSGCARGVHFRWFVFVLLVAMGLVPVTPSWAQFQVPGRWQGEILGQVHGMAFQLPVTIELSPSIEGERNPFHVFIGGGETNQPGQVSVTSALRINTANGPVTLQYLSVVVRNDRFSASLTQTHGAEAAKINGFSGPNVSAEQASNLMKDVLRSAWGAAEMFGFAAGMQIEVEQQGNLLQGTIAGHGSSYTGTSGDVGYQARFKAQRVR